jgi:3-hydroxyisobutyrate dehydrogenase-like beta-hydroxyacid dehydrogenase
MEIKTVGIIGVGNMGRGAAQALKDDYELALFDAYGPTSKKLRNEGFQVCKSPKEIAKISQIILMFLPGPKEIFSTLLGDDGLLEGLCAETIVIDHSTVDPSTSKEASSYVAKKKCQYLDAPVLGRPERAGNWTLPVGGDDQVISRAKSVLSLVAARIIPVGPIGSGNAVKLLNNLMFGVINNTTSEILSATKRLGIDPKVFFDAVVESGAATVSNLFKSIGPKIINEDFSPVFRIELMRKDMELGLKLAKEAGATMIVAESANKLTEIALAKGYAGQDSSVVSKVSDLISKPCQG